MTASADNTARLWDAESGSEIAVLKGHTAAVRSAAFSPDGKRVVTASFDNSGAAVGRGERQRDRGAQGPYRLGAERGLQPGRQAGGDGVSTTTPRGCGTRRAATRSRCSRAIRAAVQSAAFSPDGKRVVTASDDNTRAAVGRGERQRDRAAQGPYECRCERRLQPGRQAGGDGVRRQHGAAVGCGERQRDRGAQGSYGRGAERGLQPGRQAGGDGVFRQHARGCGTRRAAARSRCSRAIRAGCGARPSARTASGW